MYLKLYLRPALAYPAVTRDVQRLLVVGMYLPGLQDLRDPREYVERGRVQGLLGRDKAKLVDLRLVTHQMNSQQGVVLLQALPDDLDIRSFQVVEREVQMYECLVIDQRFCPLHG